MDLYASRTLQTYSPSKDSMRSGIYSSLLKLSMTLPFKTSDISITALKSPSIKSSE